MHSLIKQRRKTGQASVDHTTHANNSSIVAYNFDILTLILVLVPLQTLPVLKLVSKHWLSVISHPNFVYKYFLKNPSHSVRGLFCRQRISWCRSATQYDFIFLDGNISSSVPFKTLTLGLEKSGIEIVQSCNGLLLCCNVIAEANDYDTYYVFNPFTKQYRLIPRSLLKKSQFKYVLCLSLAFDPFKSPYYEIIAIWSNKVYGSRKYMIEIYSSETRSWRLCKDEFTIEEFSIPGVSAMYWNGSLNWNAGDGTVIYFDIDREFMGVVPRPTREVVYYVSNTGVCEYQGHLYFIAKRDKEGRCFDIFEMDTGHAGWALKCCSVNVKASRRRELLNLSPPDQIIFIAEEGKSLKLVFLANHGNVISYDTKELSFNKICDILPPPVPGNFFLSYPYIQSLACV
ncbi:F-box protein At5g07610-like [Papaver somniferum]|uniref:F-box protein At5g07610-like n=1 Tax=Papaver somniferum TaxID=3469 RepID=UPI000E6F92CA|nr:F-box protein At5g07610-like [Papaver somniferum]